MINMQLRTLQYDAPVLIKVMHKSSVGGSAVLIGEVETTLTEMSLGAREQLRVVGGASALVTFICALCTLRTQISRSICKFNLHTTLQPIVDEALVLKDRQQGKYVNSGHLVFQAARLLVEHITKQPEDIPYAYEAGDKPPYDIVVS
jgi:hypothetical protein